MSYVHTRILPDPNSDGVFVGVNIPPASVPPTFTSPQAPEELEPRAIWSIQWLYDPYFYLAFLPRVRRYPGILADLNMTPASIPVRTTIVDHRQVTYSLDPVKVEEMMSLYTIAYNMTVFFTSYSHLRLNRPFVFAPGDTKLSIFDVSREDLTRPRSTRGGVVWATLSARDSIMAKFAWISYAVAWHTYPEEEDPSTPPDWYLSLALKKTIPEYKLRALGGTWVFNMHAPRLGGCVPVTLPLQYDREGWGAASTTWIKYLSHIIARVPGIPYYLHYPQVVNSPAPTQWDQILHWQPTRDQIAASRDAYQEEYTPGTASTQEDNTDTYQSHHISLPTPPVLSDHRNSRMSWNTFETQLYAWFEYKQSVASEATQAQWEIRRRQALALTPWEINEGRPSWKKWTVWMWEDNGDGTWSHVAHSTARSALETHWSALKPMQKFVDPIRRAWHVSYFFPGGEEDAWWLYADPSPARARSRSPMRRNVPRSTQPRSRSPASPYPQPFEDTPAKLNHVNYRHHVPETLTACMQLRFGILPNSSPTNRFDRQMAPQVLKTVFRYERDWHGVVSDNDWALMGDLFGAHAKGTPPVDPTLPQWKAMAQALGSICDIFPSSVHPYHLRPQHYTIRSVHVPTDSDRHIPAHQAWLLLPLESRPEEQPWTVCLENALSVLQSMRADWGPDPRTLVCELVRRGIPFRTLRLSKDPIPPINNQERTGLQLLPQGYVPTIQDYAVYLTSLRDLITQCQGRPAIMKGGIIWRLAMEILGENEDWVATTMSVPTDVREPSFIAVYGTYQAVDDELTQQEEDLICGVYRIFSDQKSTELKGKNAAAVSWWPKQDLWNHHACEWNKGYWSWENELWFRKRREDILKGAAKAMTVKEWAGQMRGQWRKSLNCLEEVAALRVQTVEIQ